MSRYLTGAGEIAVKPHLAKLTSEVGDLRGDVDRALGRVQEEIDIVVSFHKPIVSPARASGPPGQLAPIEAVGNLFYMKMTPTTHAAYRTIKIPRNLIDSPKIHIHWTKGDDTDRSNYFVKWRVSYTTFDGESEDAGGAGSTLEMEEEYLDNGTTSRVVYSSAYTALTGLVAGEYMSLKVEAITPAGLALPTVGLVCLDVTYNGVINKDYGAEL